MTGLNPIGRGSARGRGPGPGPRLIVFNSRAALIASFTTSACVGLLEVGVRSPVPFRLVERAGPGPFAYLESCLADCVI